MDGEEVKIRSTKRRTLWQILTRQPPSPLSPEEYREKYKTATGIVLRPSESPLPPGMAHPIWWENRDLPRPIMPDPNKSAHRKQEPSGKSAKIALVVGIVLGLLPWGLGLIGLTVNLPLGAAILFIAFGLGVYAFWIWERASRWHVLLRVLTILIGAACYFWFVGSQLYREYRTENAQKPDAVSASPASQPKPHAALPLFLNCESISFPVPYPAFSSIYVIDIGSIAPRGLTKFGAGATPGMFPRPDFVGFGYRCDLLNYENDPVFNVSSVFKIEFREAIPNPSYPGTLNGAHEGNIVGSSDCEVDTSLIEAKSKFEFYVANWQNTTQFVEVIPPTKAQVELKDRGTPLTVEVRWTRGAGWYQTLSLTPAMRPLQ
jgi:hypothetical protein